MSASISTSLAVDVDTSKKMAEVNSDKFKTFAANTWYKLYKDFCPYNTGSLYKSVTIGPYQITHYANYAKTVYTHNRNYRTDKAPNASAYWDQAAIPTQKPKLIQSLQAYIDKGNLDL